MRERNQANTSEIKDTQPSLSVSLSFQCSGEGGIRTHGSPYEPQRFSRPPRSTTPAPLLNGFRIIAQASLEFHLFPHCGVMDRIDPGLIQFFLKCHGCIVLAVDQEHTLEGVF